jgi:hypothetical protein
MALSINGDELKQFIKENQELINSNEWDEVYWNASRFDCSEENPDGITPYLTDIFLECNINPLLYMKEIPYGYYCNSELEEFIVPDSIERITYGTLNLPNCKIFILPKNLKDLHLGIFDYVGCNDNFEVIYKGYMRDLEKYIIDPSSKPNSTFVLRKSKFKIKCSDGILEYGPNNPYNIGYDFELPF